jgi:hypothetical protein
MLPYSLIAFGLSAAIPTLAQNPVPGSFVNAGNTLVSAMMVRSRRCLLSTPLISCIPDVCR